MLAARAAAIEDPPEIERGGYVSVFGDLPSCYHPPNRRLPANRSLFVGLD